MEQQEGPVTSAETSQNRNKVPSFCKAKSGCSEWLSTVQWVPFWSCVWIKPLLQVPPCLAPAGFAFRNVWSFCLFVLVLLVLFSKHSSKHPEFGGVENVFRENTISVQLTSYFSVEEDTDMIWSELVDHRNRASCRGNYNAGSGIVFVWLEAMHQNAGGQLLLNLKEIPSL